MSDQHYSGSDNNKTLPGTQQIRLEDINDEYIAQLLSGYWPQPQNVSWRTSQNMDIPVPFSPTTMNASAPSQQPSQNSSTLPAPPAIVPSQGYHQYTFDELMRQIDRERERALVPQPGGAAQSMQTSSLQRSQQAQGSFSHARVYGFQEQPTQTIGSSSFMDTTPSDISFPAYNHPAAPTNRIPPTSSGGGSTSAQEIPPGTGEFLMYPCDLCPASFARKRDCQRHRRGHTGELPYGCEACGERFVRSDARGRHFKNSPNCEQEHHAKVKGRST